MRIWIDLANSPHVPLFQCIVERLRREGWDVLLTARDHAQTVPLARRVWPDVLVVGGESPAGRRAKALTLARRAESLRRLARSRRPDVALSHGSYAQLLAARAARVPAVTMMDYEHQPANHLSFRLARRVIVPTAFPERALRMFGARGRKVVRYAGFKEELYLAGFRPDTAVLGELGLDAAGVIAVLRAPPDGALYHRDLNSRFEDLIETARRRHDVQTVLLPRTRAQVERYGRLDGVVVPARPVDGRSLLACADLTVGGGGTMSRESALLGTPTYTVFSGRLAAVDAELIRRGLLYDLRQPGVAPSFVKKDGAGNSVPRERRDPILECITGALAEVTAAPPGKLGTG